MGRGGELEEREAKVDRAAGASVTVPPEEVQDREAEQPVLRVGDLVDGALTAAIAVDTAHHLIEEIPGIANDAMEVIGDIGEALGNVLDFDF